MGWFWVFLCTVFIAGTLIQMYHKASEDSKKQLNETAAELDALLWDYNRLRKQLGMETVTLTTWENYYKSPQYREDRLSKYLKPLESNSNQTEPPTIRRW